MHLLAEPVSEGETTVAAKGEYDGEQYVYPYIYIYGNPPHDLPCGVVCF